MKRRSFLKNSVTAATFAPMMLGGLSLRASSSLPLLAQMPAADNDKILLIIQLFGGNDGLNTVIPALDDNYYKIRPTLAVLKKDAWNKVGNVFLHPALASGSQGGIARMLELGTLAIVQGIGYENPNLSHFRSTDIWLSGINSSDPTVSLDTGWIGRYMETKYPNFPQSLPEHPLAVQFGGSFSLTLLGHKGRMGIEVENPSLQQGVPSQIDTLDDASAGTAYANEYAFVADIAGRSNKYAQAVKDAYAAGKSQLSAQYGTDTFGEQMASVAALIAGGLTTKVYVLSMGGFDNHISQQLPGYTGPHPSNLASLGDGIAQFMHDMTKLGQADRVVGLTVSEFGRRPYENGSRGTDHGAASVQFVFGTQVNSGVFGNPPDLANLDANGDLFYQIDYREVYTDILTAWFGMTLGDARTVLKDNSLVPVNVLKSQQTSVSAGATASSSFSLSGNYPNPFSTSTIFEITLGKSGHILLDITSLDGRSVATVSDRWLEAGTYSIPFSARLPAGSYLCSLRSGNRRVSRAITCVN